MTRALTPCTTPGCPTLTTGGRCPTCQRTAEQARGTARDRGYDRAHQRFRRAVLRRDPTCVIPGCTRPATDADHHPLSRRQLVAAGLNPNDPRHGRGLCHPHHSAETAKHQPGGWNNRDDDPDGDHTP